MGIQADAPFLGAVTGLTIKKNTIRDTFLGVEFRGISQSSIVKFAQKLGAQGFTELRMALIGEYSASREKTNATALHLHSSITSDDSLEVIARKLNREKELALEQT